MKQIPKEIKKFDNYLKKEYTSGTGFWHYFIAYCVWSYEHHISLIYWLRKILSYSIQHLHREEVD